MAIQITSQVTKEQTMDCAEIAVSTMSQLQLLGFKTSKVLTLELPNGEFHNVVVVDRTGQLEKMDVEKLKIISLKP